jgi:hypothetical protein
MSGLCQSRRSSRWCADWPALATTRTKVHQTKEMAALFNQRAADVGVEAVPDAHLYQKGNAVFADASDLDPAVAAAALRIRWVTGGVSRHFIATQITTAKRSARRQCVGRGRLGEQGLVVLDGQGPLGGNRLKPTQMHLPGADDQQDIHAFVASSSSTDLAVRVLGQSCAA